MDLILVRHGHDHRASQARPLSPLGVTQAEAAARWLARHRVASLWSGTSARACGTAELIAAATGLVPRFDARLDEIGTASAGLLPPRERSPWQHHQAAEDWATFRIRVGAVLSDLCLEPAEGPVVVVTHSGVFDAVHEVVCGGDRRVELDVAHAGITWWCHRRGSTAGTWLLRKHNATEHLSRP